MLIHYKKPEGLLAEYIDHFWEKKMEDQDDIPYEVETIFPEDQLVITFSLGNPYYRAVQKPEDFTPIHGAIIEALHTQTTYYKHQVGNHIFGIKFKLGGLACFSSESFKNRAQELGDKKVAVRERQVDCIGKDFRPFYNEALEKYNAQSTAN